MQYFKHAMHEDYQESSGSKAQRLSCSDIIILLQSSGVTTQPTITGQWYSGTTTQPSTTIATLDLSGTTTQPADHNAQRDSAHKEIRLNMTQLQHPAQICYSPASQKLRRKMLKAAKGQKKHWTTIAKLSNSATTSCSFNLSIQIYKLVSVESPKEDELSATNLAPSNGIN
ncbi:putative beta-1,3-galactosyltransferase 16 [Dorcoceras hygrometricum]|uniref:Putative beta-1,3-galactosyltransferase 16 n=1 Tax=Dorcoceras hygrometricum TaxID=472368 RepID=A0A2Z7BA97_9LAMI|nr:putative beta-1,3-galactosyltransferase 16 [Dorcoceras hygrometricum]